MNARNWIERLLDSVADHGLEVLGLRERDARDNPPSEAELCNRLVEGVGEASNIALAREILQRWEGMNETERLTFLELLAVEFDPDPAAIHAAADAYRANDPDSLQRLLKASEPPRQELIRRLNMAPGATAQLVAMRAHLLGLLREHPRLKSLEVDFQHLLASWFNRGFLSLRRIDWHSPAAVLEKLIQHEVVHPMNGWDDLRRRLASDRRCFAFFHPALPDEPLIFVEVALTQDVADSILPLIDPQAPPADTGSADTAMFYSINNALTGLRGISFGNFLIKQVASELARELPQLQTFATLSPIPLLRQHLQRLFTADSQDAQNRELHTLLARHDDLLNAAIDPLTRIDELLAQDARDDEQRGRLDTLLYDLALFYLGFIKRGQHACDPVAHFHLSNGATLQRINLHANPTARGLKESWGCMVNYHYDGNQLVGNHEAYAGRGEIALGKDLAEAYQQLTERLSSAGRDA